MKKTWFSFLVVCFLGGVSAADANDFKPYIGLGAGMFQLKYSENGPTGSLGMTKSTWGTFLNAGVQYKQYIGAELRTGLTGSGTATFPVNTIGNAAPIDLKIGVNSYISYLLKPQYPVTDQFKVYGIFGGTAAKFETTSTIGVQLKNSTWKTGVTYGLGLEYQFRLKGSVAVEWVEYWSDIDLGLANGSRSNASMRGVSVMVNKSF
ncbi:MAG: hypothetical protein AUJ56_01275 [Zetaproteobacteria bacterium CG1_02_49_23]|nr:MAG: hypothetical protein AUJ56_01275 [Zetaproteobacteria bacterium CG1_02_49_23]